MTEVLELSALTPERPKARITTDADPDGTIYELAVPEDFGAVDLARMGQMFSEHDNLWEAVSRSKAEDKRLEKLLNDIASKLIPDAPADAVKALPAITKRGLAVRFFVSAGLVAAPLMGPIAELASPPESR